MPSARSFISFPSSPLTQVDGVLDVDVVDQGDVLDFDTGRGTRASQLFSLGGFGRGADWAFLHPLLHSSCFHRAVPIIHHPDPLCIHPLLRLPVFECPIRFSLYSDFLRYSLVGSPLAEQLDVALVGDLLDVAGKSLNGSHLDASLLGGKNLESETKTGQRFLDESVAGGARP